MIASPNFEPRNGATVRLVVLHTAEGALDTASLGNYFANPASQVSSHVGIDDHSIAQYVDYSQAAWAMRSANRIADQAELCGFAAWTRSTWINQHGGMLNLAAQWVRERCHARGIPIVKLTPAQVAAGQAGVCGHWDWTLGMHDGTHTDPGQAFPWDVVIAAAQAGSTSGGFLMALTDAEQAEVLAGIRALKPGLVLPARSVNCGTGAKDDAFGSSLNAWAKAADAAATAQQALAEIRALRAALGK